MDPGVRSHGLKADPMVQIWMLSDEWLVRYTPLQKLWSNSTNEMDHEQTNEQTNKGTNKRTYEQKDKNYTLLGINARGINRKKSTDNLTNLSSIASSIKTSLFVISGVTHILDFSQKFLCLGQTVMRPRSEKSHLASSDPGLKCLPSPF